MSLESRIRLTPPPTEPLSGSGMEIAERLLAAGICVLLLPIWVINLCLGLLHLSAPIRFGARQDILGRPLAKPVFSHGCLRSSLDALLVFSGRLRLVGLPCDAGRSELRTAFQHLKPGLISLYALYFISGYRVYSIDTATLKQRDMSESAKYLLALRYLIARVFSRGRVLINVKRFRLFGIRITNLTMAEAVDAIVTPSPADGPRVGFFANVNSYNLARQHSGLKDVLNQADWVFADGSGVRMAAQRYGMALVDNVNGTDMLPALCDQAVRRDKSLFLVGAAPGVAEEAACKLRAQYPGLRIAGTHDGYFNHEDSQPVVDAINHSGAQIVLVAMGTPLQESWTLKVRPKLQVETVLAVGGLFDFYSGRIPRAPAWMRDLGLEWIWRLRQEPVKKFKRYVLGNPAFLMRTLIGLRG